MKQVTNWRLSRWAKVDSDEGAIDGNNFLINMFLFFACFGNISGNKYGTKLGNVESGKPVALVFHIKFLC